MAEINKIQQSNAEYIKELSQQQKIQQQKRIQNRRQEKAEKKDQINLSETGKRLAEAQQFYQKFLQKRAEEMEKHRIEKVKELKEKVQEKPNSPLQLIAEKIAEEYFGL